MTGTGQALSRSSGARWSLTPAAFMRIAAMAHLLMHLGRHDEAVREGQIAVQLDPLSSADSGSFGPDFLLRAEI